MSETEYHTDMFGEDEDSPPIGEAAKARAQHAVDQMDEQSYEVVSLILDMYHYQQIFM